MNQSDTTDRVSDAPSGNWVYRILPRRVWPYAQLARWDRPIGWWLLLWPCWWSLALAANTAIHLQSLGATGAFPRNLFWQDGASTMVWSFIVVLPAFLFGAVFMRGAGCTYNDLVDADLDARVARTASRPIPSGRVTKRMAGVFLLAQLIAGLAVLVFLCAFGGDTFNWFALFLGFLSMLVVFAYPFAKRVTDWPQLVLGLAFSWGALMGWAVAFGTLGAAPLLLYGGCILWTIGYDTIYAHQDREDDALVGVRSTARLLGEITKPALFVLYAGTLLLFAAAFSLAWTGWPSYIGLAIGCGHMIWQINRLDMDDPDNCLMLFRSNSGFGWIVFAGLMLDLVV